MVIAGTDDRCGRFVKVGDADRPAEASYWCAAERAAILIGNSDQFWRRSKVKGVANEQQPRRFPTTSRSATLVVDFGVTKM